MHLPASWGAGLPASIDSTPGSVEPVQSDVSEEATGGNPPTSDASHVRTDSVRSVPLTRSRSAMQVDQPRGQASDTALHGSSQSVSVSRQPDGDVSVSEV